jgi:hypothetical protein
MLTARASLVGEPDLRVRWERRVVEGRFSPAVAGVRRLTVFGPTGEALRAFPLLRPIGAGESRAELLASISAEERWALAWAEQAVARGREVFVVARDRGVGEPLRAFDPAEPRDILILAPESI